MTHPDPSAAVLARLRQLRAGAVRHTPATALVEGTFPAERLQLAVAGVGDLCLPPSAEQLAALRARTQPAPFGLGSQTLVDVAVRDTGEIDAHALILRWAVGAQAALCERIAAGLGLPRVELKPHKLLSYGRGQFFKAHQDTARRPAMLGTLVLIWPSAHLGGELRVEHNRSTYRFRSQQLGQDREIRWCAFYADCRHEVLPVEEGQRLALSFEVLVPDAVTPAQSSADAQLCAALRALFESGGADQAVRQRPWLLLLDHQYNEHGLRWRTLKSKDRHTASALRAAALANGYSIHLALIEQSEVWSCLNDQPDFDEWEDDEDADEEADENQAKDLAQRDPADLIDRAFTTVLRVDQDDEILSNKGMRIDAADLSCLRPSGRAHLVDQEHEDYMGNYGETMSYRYRRAALVVQSPAVALRLRYEVDTASAVRELAGRAVNPAHFDEVRAELHLVQDLLAEQLRRKQYELLPAVLDLAVSLSPTHAAQLLAPLHHAAFGLNDAVALHRLQQTHGSAWLQAQLSLWVEQPDIRWRLRETDPQGYDGAPLWPEPLDQFFLACKTQGLHLAVITQWQAALLAQFLRSQTLWQQLHPARRRDGLSQRQQWIKRLLGALCAGADSNAKSPLNGALRSISASSTYPLLSQVQLLCCIAAGGGAGHPAALEWRTQLQDALAAALATPALAAGDQSLRDIEWICRCTICTPVIQWAESPSASPYRVAIAEQWRQHISQFVQWSGAPISTETIKQGRPYILQCQKAADARQRHAEQRQALKLAHTQLQALAQQGN